MTMSIVRIFVYHLFHQYIIILMNRFVFLFMIYVYPSMKFMNLYINFIIVTWVINIHTQPSIYYNMDNLLLYELNFRDFCLIFI